MNKLLKTITLALMMALILCACTSETVAEDRVVISFSPQAFVEGELSFENFPWYSTVEEVVEGLGIDHAQKSNNIDEDTYSFSIPVYYEDLEIEGTANFGFLINNDDQSDIDTSLTAIQFNTVISAESEDGLENYTEKMVAIHEKLKEETDFMVTPQFIFDDFEDIRGNMLRYTGKISSNKADEEVTIDTFYSLSTGISGEDNSLPQDLIQNKIDAELEIYGGHVITWTFSVDLMPRG